MLLSLAREAVSTAPRRITMPRVPDPIQPPAASKFEASPAAPPPLDCPRRGTYFLSATRGPGTVVRFRALPRAATVARGARRHARPAVVSRQGERNGHLPASAQTCRRVRRLARPRSRRGCGEPGRVTPPVRPPRPRGPADASHEVPRHACGVSGPPLSFCVEARPRPRAPLPRSPPRSGPARSGKAPL